MEDTASLKIYEVSSILCAADFLAANSSLLIAPISSIPVVSILYTSMSYCNRLLIILRSLTVASESSAIKTRGLSLTKRANNAVFRFRVEPKIGIALPATIASNTPSTITIASSQSNYNSLNTMSRLAGGVLYLIHAPSYARAIK